MPDTFNMKSPMRYENRWPKLRKNCGSCVMPVALESQGARQCIATQLNNCGNQEGPTPNASTWNRRRDAKLIGQKLWENSVAKIGFEILPRGLHIAVLGNHVNHVAAKSLWTHWFSTHALGIHSAVLEHHVAANPLWTHWFPHMCLASISRSCSYVGADVLNGGEIPASPDHICAPMLELMS